MRRSWLLVLAGAMSVAALGGAAALAPRFVGLGKQPDGTYIVSSGQTVEAGAIKFRGRPIDLALHPSGAQYAVLSKSEILIGGPEGIRGRPTPLQANAAFRGLRWSPDGSRLFASTDRGHVHSFAWDGKKLAVGPKLDLRPTDAPKSANPVPGGMAMTTDGRRLFVVAGNRNSVVEFDAVSGTRLRELAVETLPFECRLAKSDSLLVVSNWAGRIPRTGDRTAKSQNLPMAVDDRGAPASGTVSLVELATAKTTHIDVGIHPCALAIDGDAAFVTNALSDTISEIRLSERRVVRTIPIRWGELRVFGSMPNALAATADRIYSCNGGDNAVCEIERATGKVLGFRPAGYFPTAIELSADGQTAYVLNTKGNGSVSRTAYGRPGNAHDFEGTVSVIGLKDDLARATARVAELNHWGRKPAASDLPVFNGAVKHVVYIIKENRTYDEVFGDLPTGNGDPKLCSLGEKVMPNHRAIARQFTLFDNGYVSGTNSADGHAWATQCMATDYLEHFYVGYSRTYPDDGRDPMVISTSGCLWDAALKKGKSVRVYGEYCEYDLAKIEPKPKDWFEVWEDRKAGTKKFKFTAVTNIPSLKPLIHPEYHYWPLFMSDQQRADIFIREFRELADAGRLPNLMIMSLPCDHGEGLDPKYPTPRAMMADNDLALGRIVEAISNHPKWRDTCIFVIEDDAQSGPDHIDGHRTVFMAIGPYVKRKHLDSTLYTQGNMFRTMEMMLGLDPMNKFDALAYPMADCFGRTPDLTPYKAVPNNVPLDERNPSGPRMSEADRRWQRISMGLDWSHIDAPDPYWLNRVNWYSIYGESRPYPARPGEAPGVRDDDDDD